MSNNSTIETGIGFGAAFAIVLSSKKWRSFWWVILYAIWYFVIKNYN